MIRMIHIGNCIIGEASPCYVIAEAGVNHNGDPDRAIDLINTAASAGANAIKFQTFKTDSVVTKDAIKASYQKQTTGMKGSQYDLIRNLELSYDVFRELKKHSERKGIEFLSTPFDLESVNFLDEIGVSAFKIPSGEINNKPLLEAIAKKQKPILLSTGMSTLDEVENAVRTIFKAGTKEILILHCVTNYPAAVNEVNLRAMDTMRKAFGLPVGYSDHTLGITIPIAAVSLGASVIEKHFTLDKTLPGPDHKASLEPHELSMMIQAIHDVEVAMGSGVKAPSLSEIDNLKTIRRSVVAAVDIPKNTIIMPDHIAIKRPGTGISPEYLSQIVGLRSTKKIPKDALLKWSDLARTKLMGD